MKKSLVALAVLAASGAAMAQSSVTLYGIADVWVGSVKSETGSKSTTTTSMISGGVSTSRWGMKGTEDLGGGLKATFQFEQGVGLDTGDASGFTRQANVGFAGGFGAVKLGVVPTPFDNVQGASDGVFDSDLSPANDPAGGVFLSANKYTGKAKNAIYYSSPDMSGLKGEFLYALDEDSTTMPSITSLALSYAAGPLAAQFAYQAEDLSTKSSDVSFLRLGASYNFGVATAKFTYGAVDNVGNVDGAKASEFQIGADMPLSAAMTLSASYAMSDDNDKAGDAKRSGFGMAVAYGLSKRTTLYGGFKMAKLEPKTGSDTDYTVFAAGVKHTF